MGTCSTFLLCAGVHYYSRWPVGFLISGGLQISWAILWVLLVTDFPKAHSFISKEELEYLINTIGNVFTIKVGNCHRRFRFPKGSIRLQVITVDITTSQQLNGFVLIQECVMSSLS